MPGNSSGLNQQGRPRLRAAFAPAVQQAEVQSRPKTELDWQQPHRGPQAVGMLERQWEPTKDIHTFKEWHEQPMEKG